jgi:hypothetical protein
VIGYVKIEKCSHGGWYKDLIGQMYPVYKDEGIEWATYELAGYKNFILKKDCNSDLYEYNRDLVKENNS